jgi:glycosyltransferase involved in cell wall biosynthesis
VDGGAILFLLPSLDGLGGGIERYERALVEAVARLRPAAELVAVLGREADAEVHARMEMQARTNMHARMTVIGAGAGGRARRIAALAGKAAAAAARFRPSLIVCGHVHYAPLGAALARAARARLLVLAHGIEAWAIDPRRSRPTAQALRSAHVAAVSAFTAAQLALRLRLDPAHLHVLHNPVDTARFSPGAPSEAMLRKLGRLARPRLLTVARLDAEEGYKGVDVVLRALAGPARPLAAAYAVAGDGTDLVRLRALAADLGLDARVEFLGRVAEEELVDLYRACDLFVMPSRGEGFGYVFAEAMACGLPAVAGCADGSVDALGGGRLGLLVDPLDPGAVAAALADHLAGRSDARMRDAAWLHAEVEARFGLAAFDRRLGALLDALSC